MKHIPLTLFFLFFFTNVFAAGDIHSNLDKNEIRHINNNRRLPDVEYQYELRNRPNWQYFLQQNGTWFVIFNEENARPHKAFGKPIPVFGVDGRSRALNFIGNHLQGFNIPLNELEFSGSVKSENYEYVNFTQNHNGLEILNSCMSVKLTSGGKVVMFGADVFSDINISNIQPIAENIALEKAKENLGGTITNITLMNAMKILPLPEFKRNIYKLVYEIMIETIDQENIPGKYQTLVDAETGTVLSRVNLVRHFHPEPGGAGATVTGTLYTTHSYNPSSENPLANLKITQNGNTFYTDAIGEAPGLESGSATFFLEGLWCKIRTGSTTPSFTSTLSTGANSVSFNSNANIRERSAYYHVNVVHDYMKSFFPSFTSMDNPLETNIDVTGTCNAFYNGSSINFYASGGGCNSFATVADVVYHEYGHGINDKYYQFIGNNFQNGAMHEGYADVWAMGITENPVLGIGNSSTDPNEAIRVYNEEPKVYPNDITGEVHNDGEIIAGAWWDYGVNIGNTQAMMDLFARTFNAGITGPDGTEGQVYVDILIEALSEDDILSNGGDNDITNGTPNDIALVNAFDRHGITLLSNAIINHTAISANSNEEPIAINATINLQYPWALENALLFYKINRNGNWETMQLNNTNGNNYSAQIPGQPLGTLIAYYLALQNLNGVLSSVQPIAADVDPYPNTPYFILNGFKLEHTEDFDNTQGQWVEGLPSDNNTTGEWIIDVPMGSYSDGIPVQADHQTTPGGLVCAVTGNASSTSAGIGENDVDGGHTTLVSPTFDLTGYTNPLFTFMKWYTNNPPSGANPRADWWQVQVTDNGSTWHYVENTLAGERNWRRFAFRVSDYVSLTSNFKIRFIASDSTRQGQYLDGGSLIEAAIDDLKLYEEGIDNSSVIESVISLLNIFPVPAKDFIQVSFETTQSENIILQLYAMDGRLVNTVNYGKCSPGLQRYILDVSMLSAGMYFLKISSGEHQAVRKFTTAK